MMKGFSPQDTRDFLSYHHDLALDVNNLNNVSEFGILLSLSFIRKNSLLLKVVGPHVLEK